MSETYINDLDTEKQRNLIDKLRQIGVGDKIQLPQIAVFGDTSAGKSSVLSSNIKSLKSIF